MIYLDIALQVILLSLIIFIISKPLGVFIHNILQSNTGVWPKLCSPVENYIYRASGIQSLSGTDWKCYLRSLLLTNAAVAVIIFLILIFQHLLPFNPNNAQGMDLTLAIHTVVSFLTNTDLQHYSGESSLSYFSQMVGLTTLMFVAPATGLASLMAVLRGLAGMQLGNFFVDFIRINIRLLLPLALIFTVVLVAGGAPQTLSPTKQVTTLEGKKQSIALGPVASMVAIKQLGNNGGGFFATNATHPFENPTATVSILQVLAMLLITTALPFTYGKMLNNMKQGTIIFGVMFCMLIIFVAASYYVELDGNSLLSKLSFDNLSGSMEGKEMRMGIGLTSLYTAISGATGTGAVNTMYDTLTPLGGMVPIILMMLGTVFGGIGVGLLNVIVYVILTVFLAGLMVGRTPELLGKKIEPKEIKWMIIILLTPPVLILVPTALAFMGSYGVGTISNPGFHGISQVLTEFTSSAANNGCGFEGLKDNTLFWNLSTAFVMLLGRYLPIIALLAVANSLLHKQTVPETLGTLSTDNLTFGVMLLITIFLIGALTFFPVLMLGPIAEFLTIR